MEKMWQVLFLILLALVMQTFFSTSLPAQEKQTSGTNVAVINGTAITQGDFDRAMKEVQQRHMSRGESITKDQLQKIQTEVLEALIDGELLYQESQNTGIKVDEAAITERFMSFKNRFPSEDDFNDALHAMDLSEADLTTQLRRDLAIQQFIAKQFNDKLTVSDKETKNFYDSNPDAFKKPGQLKVSQILVKVPPKADKAQKATARKKIEEIQEKITEGGDFAALAKAFSEGPNSAAGGDLGFFGPGDMPKPFENTAFALAPGEVSGIVETEFGYHIIKSVDKKPATTIAYKDIKGKLQQYLRQKKLQEQVVTYTDELEKKGKVERFIKENS